MPRRVWLVLFLLLLTTSTRIEHLQKIQQVYIYYFPVIGGGSAFPAPPRPPVRSKKGVGLTYGCASFGAWGYSWSENPPICLGMETVPMIWGGYSIPTKVGGNSQWLMGFNEPDRPDQSNLTPENAVDLWVAIEKTFPDKRLVAPAPSHLDPGWVVRFREAYIKKEGHPPRLDALAVHCYLQYAASCEALTQKYIGWADTWGIKEVWVTETSFSEMGGIRTRGAAWSEASEYLNWVNANQKVTRIAWFASVIYGTETWSFPQGWNASLLNPDGSLSYWGLKYR